MEKLGKGLGTSVLIDACVEGTMIDIALTCRIYQKLVMIFVLDPDQTSFIAVSRMVI